MCGDFFGVEDFAKDFLGGLKKSVTQGSHFYVNFIYKRKLHANYYFFNAEKKRTFWVTFWAVGLFWGLVLA